MIVIGITGGIASGKSTVARLMKHKGIAHIDADKLVHHLIARDADTKSAIALAIPQAVHEGTVKREALAALVARDATILKTLEQILHPRVRRAEMHAILRAARHRKRAVLLDVPLLFETGCNVMCDMVIAVQATPALQRRRAMQRRGMTPEKFERLIARQWNDAQRAACADVVITTALGKGHTARAVQKLMKQLDLR